MLFRKLALSAVLMAMCGAPCLAQEGTRGAGRKPPTIEVRLTGPDDALTGRLLSLDADTLSIEVRRKRVDLPMSRVVLIERQVPDSVWDGALLMAAFVAVCNKRWCPEGSPYETVKPPDPLIGALVAGVIGAIVDSTIYRREVIFEAPTSPAEKAVVRRQPRPMIAVGVRF